MRSIEHPTNVRSRRTRAALLASARRILEADGFEALTMTRVAEETDVTRRTVYLHFGSRSELVGALFNHVADAEGLERSVERVWDAPDSVTALAEWAAHLARYHPRVIAVDRAVARVWRADADAAAHRKTVVRAKLANCRRLVEWLEAEDKLAPAWSLQAATDMLFALISSDMIEALIADRRWSRRRLAEHLALLFRSTFVRDAA
jgi:AcrR family transcriptional regulator